MAAVHSSVWKWYGLALLILLLDQGSKMWVSANFVYGKPWVITDFFNFTLLHNTGAAFSFLSDAGGWQRWFFGVVASAVSVVLVVWLSRIKDSNPGSLWRLHWCLAVPWAICTTASCWAMWWTLLWCTTANIIGRRLIWLTVPLLVEPVSCCWAVLNSQQKKQISI